MKIEILSVWLCWSNGKSTVLVAMSMAHWTMKISTSHNFYTCGARRLKFCHSTMAGLMYGLMCLLLLLWSIGPWKFQLAITFMPEVLELWNFARIICICGYSISHVSCIVKSPYALYQTVLTYHWWCFFFIFMINFLRIYTF